MSKLPGSFALTALTYDGSNVCLGSAGGQCPPFTEAAVTATEPELTPSPTFDDSYVVNDGEDGLGTEAFVGIGVGAAVFVIIGACLALYFLRQRKIWRENKRYIEGHAAYTTPQCRTG